MGVILILLLTVPLLVPVSPLPGLVPPEQLAGNPDSEFIEVNGLRLHVKRSGQGDPAMILLHGFGSHTETSHAVRPTPVPRLARSSPLIAPALG